MTERIDAERQADQFRQFARKQSGIPPEVTFTSWADSQDLTPEQQRAVREESDLLEVVEE